MSEVKLNIFGVILLAFLLNFNGVKSNPCAGLPSGQFVNNPERCEYFFACVGGQAFPQTCPIGFFFDAARQACVDSSLLPCTNPPLTDCPKEGLALIAVNGTCVKYTMCVNGERFLLECAPGTLFDRVKSQCNLESIVTCETPLTCPATDFLLIRHPTDNTKYNVCHNGKAFQQSCAPSLIFDPIRSHCRIP